MNMRFASGALTGLELTTVILALVVPTAFVNYAAILIAYLTFASDPPLAYAYGVIVAVVCALSSVARKLSTVAVPSAPSKATTLLSLMTVVIAAFIFYSLTNVNMRQLNAELVVTPYLSYLLSVAFCMGVGYAAADLLTSLTSKD
jgi:hypothetical protein